MNKIYYIDSITIVLYYTSIFSEAVSINGSRNRNNLVIKSALYEVLAKTSTGVSVKSCRHRHYHENDRALWIQQRPHMIDLSRNSQCSSSSGFAGNIQTIYKLHYSFLFLPPRGYGPFSFSTIPFLV